MLPPTCVVCHGTGRVSDVHVWSDGPSMVELVCPLCDGVGTADPVAVALDAKRRLRAAEATLLDLRTAAALYLAVVEDGQLPDPPLANAIRPSPHRETWVGRLRSLTAGLPRVATTTTAVGR